MLEAVPCGDHEDLMSFETILAWQQRGINARVLGLSEGENPVLPHLESAGSEEEKEGWLLRSDAWFFGWRIEDASRA
jgi:hypothetical protein